MATRRGIGLGSFAWGEYLAEQAPEFRNGNRELWWVAPLQGHQGESVLQRMHNPLMEAAH
ncbi:MAG: hypothetical protein IPL59_18870 [Candidatus Competibacteraceae bacterium]|uniref:hypothetical protein n=1 Tax=Candidatus Contendibacter odensensis TaxID=1400860 RepID=UPI00055311BA|nr:hypothetical protein [Candidatus Contendobacter odensis]MBK8536969.1 hypothetical protein [Candidatus Competibacteraceae bacterium]